MSKRIFNEKQIKELLKNPNVEKCSDKSISYNNDFKVLAVRKYYAGLSPNEIFRQANFDIKMIGCETPTDRLRNWRKIFKEKGVQKLSVENRGKKGGRPKTNWSNEKEKIKYLETQVAYLKAENNFLVKLRKKSLN
jgi:hypothetical protein